MSDGRLREQVFQIITSYVFQIVYIARQHQWSCAFETWSIKLKSNVHGYPILNEPDFIDQYRDVQSILSLINIELFLTNPVTLH